MSSRIVTDPPVDPAAAFGRRLGGWWHEHDGRIVCDLCPRACTLKEGDRGFCFVRKNEGGQMVLTTYGLSTGFCVDPIEKKPLAHFYPGSSVLSFGTAGCNLGCKFCQNWTISKSREITDLSDRAGPEAIAEQAERLGCRSVAFTYNDPVIWAEYALDCARACHARGIKTVAVTAGYISPGAREAFYAEMDAANVDLKAFTEHFYQHLTLAHLQPVLDTLKYLKHETDVWFEITDLLIPDENDSPGEIERMCAWIAENLGTDVPLHFTAFHPDFRLRDKPPTPPETLIRAREQAIAAGLKFVYVGNVFDNERQSTYCPNCGTCVIERDWHALGAYRLEGNHCAQCGHEIAGHFDSAPGNWGRRRLPLRINSNPSELPGVNHTNDTREGEAPAESVAGSCSVSTARQEPCPPAEAPRPPDEAPRPPAPLPELDEAQRSGILQSAARLVEQAVALGPNQLQRVASGQTALQAAAVRELAQSPVYGVFVSLKNRGQLRACCGNVGQTARLADSLTAAAIRSATADRRFTPIDYSEIADLDLEVWLLHSPRPVEASGRDRLEHVVIGRHGLVLDQGPNRGLLLPGVAVEAGMDAAEFLEAICRKAQLPPGSWMNDQAQLSTFEGASFSGRLRDYLPADWRPDEHPQYAGLLNAVREVWNGRLNGGRGTPYWSGMADGEVAGIILTARALGGSVGHWSRLEPEGGMPLQATLAQLAEQAAEELAAQAATAPQQLEGLHPRLVVLRHGVPHSMPLGGDALQFEAARHALFVRSGARRALVLPPHENPRMMFHKACQSAGLDLHDPGITAWSFDCIQVRTPSLEKERHGGNATNNVRTPTLDKGGQGGSATNHQTLPDPTAAAADTARPAARAGLFYPADAAQLAELVDSLVPANGEPESWPAVMVPHAGLRYSGRIAGSTFARVKFPPTAIVIGPKHTPYGVRWAVEPHARWSLPGGTLEADRDLAAALVEAVPGLQFDTAAHQLEHAIEVELPFIHKLAPETRIVGVALGMADLDDCREFAEHLAALVRGLRPAPLLVISSDMNHFATETENRRLDRMAIDAMFRRDPEELYHTVRDNNISMCGVLPAVIVMQTLRNLDQLDRAELVGYTTSAETTGDTSSVVGYCGMLLG